jgi:hypothetical protein
LVGPNAPWTGLGAAAGYPTVTVPAGYTGRTPQGLSFFGPAWSEGKLLSFAYAYEQATHRREPPTTINPGIWESVCDPSKRVSRVYLDSASPVLDPALEL